MPNMLQQDLQDLLLRHEGMALKPYRDTIGKLTIGCGRNLDDVGISKAEAMILLEHDALIAIGGARGLVPMFDLLTRPRQLALIDMAFNLGSGRLAKFHDMLKAISLGDYSGAAAEMLDSKWAEQVGNRAHELAGMMRGSPTQEI